MRASTRGSGGLAGCKMPRRYIFPAGVCARMARGQATPRPAISLMKSRRRMEVLQARQCKDYHSDLQRQQQGDLIDWTKGQHSSLQKMRTVWLVLWAARPDESHGDRKTF